MAVCLSSPGQRCGVGELGPEVVTFLSHATEQRLRNLLERVTEVAQHKNIRFKVCQLWYILYQCRGCVYDIFKGSCTRQLTVTALSCVLAGG